MPASAEASNFHYGGFRQLGASVLFTAWGAFPKHCVCVEIVLRTRDVFQIVQRVVATVAVAVIHLLIIRTRSYESSHDDTVDTPQPSSHLDPKVLTRALRPKHVAAPRVSDASEIAHLVQPFMPDHWQPALCHVDELYHQYD